MRKYTTEFTLVLTVGALQVCRSQDLTPQTILDVAKDAHLYIVSSRPRVSIDPGSVSIDDEFISGVVRVQHEGSYTATPFRRRHHFDPTLGPHTWTAEWPYEVFTISEATGSTVSQGVVALLHCVFPGWPVPSNNRVLYIGQAFGKAGERTAADRLRKHETLQKILADASPDTQIWLTLAGITDKNLVPEIDGRMATRTTDEEDNSHVQHVFDRVFNAGFDEREGVALAEAGLIRYFEPPYNRNFKTTFPDASHVSLGNARNLDIHTLVVELQSLEVFSSFGSDVVPQDYEHFAGYQVHVEPGRDRILALESTNTLKFPNLSRRTR